ncbi:hypothetical protein [Chitinophaga silvisoli]|uniref:Uncharacterized protein n=1 Tax=Chitinophaga silvisoli TaxID=2291814 RepID=A0A3E1P2K9_9BACT|nr:hypothetical protein [Chitinophaga silvisoli]RFM34443.1 hypothetical protein DXN04_14290 [Chitinophaga silvisoli]
MKEKHLNKLLLFRNRCLPDEYLIAVLDWAEATMRDDKYCSLNKIERSRIAGIWRLLFKSINVIYRITYQFDKSTEIETHLYFKGDVLFLRHYIDIASPKVHKQTVTDIFSYYHTSSAGEGHSEAARAKIMNTFLAFISICKPLYKVGEAILFHHENKLKYRDENDEDED